MDDNSNTMLEARVNLIVTELELLKQDNRAAAASRAETQARFDKLEARLERWFVCQIAVLIISVSTLIVLVIERWR